MGNRYQQLHLSGNRLRLYTEAVEDGMGLNGVNIGFILTLTSAHAENYLVFMSFSWDVRATGMGLHWMVIMHGIYLLSPPSGAVVSQVILW